MKLFSWYSSLSNLSDCYLNSPKLLYIIKESIQNFQNLITNRMFLKHTLAKYINNKKVVVIVDVNFYDNRPIKFCTVAKDNFILSIEVDDA